MTNNDYLDILNIAKPAAKASSNDLKKTTTPLPSTETTTTLDWNAMPEPYAPPPQQDSHPEYKMVAPKKGDNYNTPTILSGFVGPTKPAPLINESSLWEIEPEERIFHDIPDEETLREQDAGDALANLFKPSNDMVEKIQQYLEENNIPKVPRNNIVEDKNKLHFNYGDYAYLITNEEIKKDLHVMMLDLAHPATLRHTLNRRPNLLKNLEQHLPQSELFKENIILKTLPKEFLITQITKTLSFIISNKLITEKNPQLTFRKETVASSLGRMLLESFITLQYKYISITDYKTNVDAYHYLKDGFGDKDGIFEFSKRGAEDIKKIVISLHAGDDDYLQYPGIIPIPPELRELALYTLVTHCETLTPPVAFPFTQNVESLDSKFVTYASSLGFLLIRGDTI